MFVIYRGRSLTLDDSLRKIYFINMLSPSVFTGEKEIFLPSEFSKHHLKNDLFKNLKRILMGDTYVNSAHHDLRLQNIDIERKCQTCCPYRQWFCLSMN